MKNLREKTFDKINNKLKKLGCQNIIQEVNERGGVFSIIFDLYESMPYGVDDFKSAYESVLSEGFEKENIINSDGDVIYKYMKIIATYAFQLYFDDKLNKERFFILLTTQANRYNKEINEKEQEWSSWTCEVDFLWWVYAVLKMKENE